MNSSGPFMIYDWTKRELGTCEERKIQSKTASVNGYQHTRRVKQVDGSYEISDICDKDYQILFHTPCEVRRNNEGCQLVREGKVLCIIKTRGVIEEQKSKRSLYYLKQQDTTCLSIRGQAGKEITTVFKIVEGDTK